MKKKNKKEFEIFIENVLAYFQAYMNEVNRPANISSHFPRAALARYAI